MLILNLKHKILALGIVRHAEKGIQDILCGVLPLINKETESVNFFLLDATVTIEREFRSDVRLG